MEEPTPQPGERTPLRGHPPQSRTTTHGWSALLLGIPFIGAGGAILMLALGRIDYPRSSIHQPPGKPAKSW